MDREVLMNDWGSPESRRAARGNGKSLGARRLSLSRSDGLKSSRPSTGNYKCVLNGNDAVYAMWETECKGLQAQAAGGWLRITQPQGVRAPVFESCPQTQQHREILLPAAMTSPLNVSRSSVWSLFEAIGQRAAAQSAATKQANWQESAETKVADLQGSQIVGPDQDGHFWIGYDYWV